MADGASTPVMPATENAAASVRILDGPRSGSVLRLHSGDQVTFGRGDVDVIIDRPWVSKRHGLLTAGPHFVTVTRYPGTGNVWVAAAEELLDPHVTGDIGDEPAAPAVVVAEGDTEVVTRGPATIDLPGETGNGDGLGGVPALEVTVLESLINRSPRPGHHDGLTMPTVSTLREHEDHLVLVALCERLLRPDLARRQVELPSIGALCARVSAAGGKSYTPKSMTNVLTRWRARLGVSSSKGAARCSCALAVAAIQSGVVVDTDVDRLPRL